MCREFWIWLKINKIDILNPNTLVIVAFFESVIAMIQFLLSFGFATIQLKFCTYDTDNFVKCEAVYVKWYCKEPIYV